MWPLSAMLCWSGYSANTVNQFGKMKTLYESLKRRYGSLMQIGVHFNFSFPECFGMLYMMNKAKQSAVNLSQTYFGNQVLNLDG